MLKLEVAPCTHHYPRPRIIRFGQALYSRTAIPKLLPVRFQLFGLPQKRIQLIMLHESLIASALVLSGQLKYHSSHCFMMLHRSPFALIITRPLWRGTSN